MNIQFDSMSNKSFFEWIANKFVAIAMPEITILVKQLDLLAEGEE